MDCKDIWMWLCNGRVGVFGLYLLWGDFWCGWDFVFIGYGDVLWEDVFCVLDVIGYDGLILIEWEDVGMDWLYGVFEVFIVVCLLLWLKLEVFFDVVFCN